MRLKDILEDIEITLHTAFSNIAYRNYNHMLSAEKEVKEQQAIVEKYLESNEFDIQVFGKIADRMKLLGQSFNEAGFTTIIFSSMALEAYIYVYGTKRLGNSFFKRHLDHLNIINKWVIVPMLVTGKPFPKDRRAFELLNTLVKERNALVHYKPVKISVTAEKIDAIFEESLTKVKLAIEALEAVAEEMGRLDPNEDSISEIASWRKPPMSKTDKIKMALGLPD